MKALAAIAIFFCSINLFGQDTTKTNVLFILDASSSMTRNWGNKSKWDIAKETLVEVSDSLLKNYSNLHLGLRAYGHQSLPNLSNCEDTELKLPIGKHSVQAIESKLNEIKPKGITPVAYTLEQTAYDFAEHKGERNILILITDGAESCQGDPCNILKILLENEIIIKPIVIGLDIPIESLQTFSCVKDLYNAENSKVFAKKILQTINLSIRFTTLQVKLLDQNKLATKTDIPMLFYRENTQQLEQAWYHKLAKKNFPDTLLMDPMYTYRLELQTIPPIVVNNIQLSAYKHNILEVSTPTGQLEIISIDESKNVIQSPFKTPVFVKIGKELIYEQDVNTTETYVSQTYNVDILTLPPIQLKNVKVEAGKTTTIKIFESGKLTMNSKFPLHGAIFEQVNNELIKIYSFKPNTKQEILDLQPGSYSILYRYSHEVKTTKTKEVDLKIESNKILEIKL